MAGKNTKRRGSRLKLLGTGALVGLLLAAFLIFWFFFRDTAPPEVGSAESADAVAASIAEAAEQETTGADPAQTAPLEVESDTEVDVGQPDSAASVGAPTDGIWTVDTSFGPFDESCITEACGATFVGFRINEVLARFGAKTVVGRTGNVTGSLELQGTQVTAASFVVDMESMQTDDPARTTALKGESGGLETLKFPEAIFVLAEPIELGELPAEGAAIDAMAVGDLTVHGVTQRVNIPLTAEMQAGVIIVSGNLEGMQLADYDIPKPQAIVVVSVEDTAIMELQLFFSR